MSKQQKKNEPILRIKSEKKLERQRIRKIEELEARIMEWEEQIAVLEEKALSSRGVSRL
ncbi:hypothetical protein GCM10020331_016370 [Ectobacillus funiculus]